MDEKQVANQEAVEMVEVSMSVPKGLMVASDAIADLVSSVIDLSKDGLNAQDIPAIVAKLLQDFQPIASNFSSIVPAFKEHPMAAGIVLANAFDKVLSK